MKHVLPFYVRHSQRPVYRPRSARMTHVFESSEPIDRCAKIISIIFVYYKVDRRNFQQRKHKIR